MKRKFRITAVIVLLMVAQTRAQSQLPPALQEAVRSALKEDAALKNHQLEEKQMENQIGLVKEKTRPQVSLIGGTGFFDHRLSLDLPTVQLPIVGTELFRGSTTLHTHGYAYAGMANVTQVIYGGGQIRHGLEALESKKEGQHLLNEAERDRVILDVVESFDQLKYLTQAEQLINESEKRLDKESERVRKAIELGLAIPYDRDKIKLARLELDTKKMELNGTRQLLYLKINKLTGYNEEQIDRVVYALSPLTTEESEAGIANRKELQALQAFDEALASNLKKEKGSLLPSVGAFANVGYAGLFKTNTGFTLPVSGDRAHLKMNHLGLTPQVAVGVAFKWDVLKGFGKKYEVENVQIDREILSNKRQETEKLLNLQLKNARVQYEVLTGQLNIAEQKKVIAKNNLVIADKQYKLGLINITERLKGETDVVKTATDYAQLLVAQRKAALAVFSAQGTLESSILND